MSNSAKISQSEDFTFDLRQAKGLVTHLPFPDVNKLAKTNETELFKLPVSSVLGTPRYFALTLGGVTLPNEPLISISASKTIVSTPVKGGKVIVKEIIGADDWKINVKGYAVREGATRERVSGGLVPQDYPEEWLRALINLYNRNEAVACQCQLLSYFNVSQLVIEDISFPSIPGAHGYFAYELNAVSDESALAKISAAKRVYR